MIVLTVRTDKPESEIGLYENQKQLAYISWQAHRQLAETVHKKIHKLLEDSGKSWPGVQGILCYKGPGSFTGLRIGLTVGNALASSYKTPIISQGGDDWLAKGLERLSAGENETIALPEYGGEIFTTSPRK